MVDLTGQHEVPPEALFAVWASSEHHMQWKTMQWVVQVGGAAHCLLLATPGISEWPGAVQPLTFSNRTQPVESHRLALHHSASL